MNLVHQLLSLSRPTTTSSLATTAATTLMAFPTPPAVTPLFVLYVTSPSVVLLATLSLLFARPAPPSAQSPSPITSVVVATRTHRRALIYAFLSLAGLTYLLDGLSFVIEAVIRKEWPQWAGFDAHAIIGLVAFSGVTLKPSSVSHRVYSPRCSAIPAIVPVSTVDDDESDTVAYLPQRIEAALRDHTAVVLLEELQTGVEGLGNVIKTFEDVFTAPRSRASTADQSIGLRCVQLV